MKKTFLLGVFLCFVSAFTFAQKNNTVDISDEVYELLRTSEIRGLCSRLQSVKPYTENYIIGKLNEIKESLENSSDEKMSERELSVIEFQLSRFERTAGVTLKKTNYRAEGEVGGLPVSFDMDWSTNGFFSGGLYSKSDVNSFGYELWENLDITGDLGNHVSYRAQGYIEATEMEMKSLGEYEIGYWWYDEGVVDKDDNVAGAIRKIKNYRNYNVLPYSYKKNWDGSVYFLKGGVNAGGLEGWPQKSALAFGGKGEIHGSFYDGLIDVSIGRLDREWASMDDGASLVLNANARPFFAFEAEVRPFKWIGFSTMTGFMEFPNQKYMLKNAWYLSNGNGAAENAYPDGEGEDADSVTSVKDSYFFHNLYSIGVLDVDFKYLHWDFGSAVVYPNRFELGYAFPLIDRVMYQNNVGDYDNLSLFTNLKLRYPGIGFVWGSFFLDEMNSLTAKLFKATRCMFAYQAGTKVYIPWLPFASFTFRYTKVEPYCYTHQALANKAQPYFSSYISENYSNNGECLGYYLPPNADEFFVKVETKPLPASSFSLQYQFIRHCVDWGSKSYMASGSSIYSELTTGNREDLRKFFLHDGTYEWMNIITLEGSYNFNRHGLPLTVFGSLGYVHNWFTTINQPLPNADRSYTKSYDYEKFSDDEYTENHGFVVSVGFKAFR